MTGGDEPGDEGGESACYANLVCPVCGAIVDDAHGPPCPEDGPRV